MRGRKREKGYRVGSTGVCTEQGREGDIGEGGRSGSRAAEGWGRDGGGNTGPLVQNVME